MIDKLTLKNIISFFNKIEETKTCWVWKAYKDKDGYGKLTVYSKERKGPYQYSAHRISFELFKGEIPKELQVDHLCRNRACVNPDHLELVTIKQNILRGVGLAAMNERKTHCAKGHPYSHKNLYGYKVCRICHNENCRRFYHKKRRGELSS